MSTTEQKLQDGVGKRRIVTHYTFFGLHRRTVRSLHIEAACRNAFRYMLENRFQASTAEIYCEESGKVYLTIRLTVDGNIMSFFGPAAKQKAQNIKNLLSGK